LNVTRALTPAECQKYLREKSCPESAKAVAQMVAAKHLALEGKTDEAIRSFQAALKSHRAPKLDPSVTAKKLAHEGDVAEAERLATEGKISEAKARYAHVESLGAGFDVSPQSWNNLCWYGSLWGHAAEVLNACEKAVAGWKENGQIRDSRGVARSLTGNFKGAVEDFRFFLANYTDDSPATRRRKSWIAPLEKGQNPITPEVIQELFKE
jgi:tetratricopeptide (TPR) repeat protein